jgi:aryl-alcohol dehydrogenase-like predicted oxidoreductase
VIVKEALANGRLSPRGAVVPLVRAARRLGVSEDALAIAGVLARPWVDTVLSGATTSGQLQSNLAAFDIRWNAGLEDELSSLTDAPGHYWDTRARLPWT